MSINITTELLAGIPNFSTLSFGGVVDYGIPSSGNYAAGYKMIAFEPGKILQAQELLELQYRMNVHQTLTMEMISNWMTEIIISGSAETSGPGWDGATPISPNNVLANNSSINLKNDSWYLCKANSSGLYFWLYFKTDAISIGTFLPISNVPVNSYIGFNLNTSGGGEYTGEIATCNTEGLVGNHPLTVANSSACGSSRYYLKITDVVISTQQITNSFVAIAQRRSDGFYFINNIKVPEA